MSVASDLIRIKDEIHDSWYKMQRDKRVEHDMAIINEGYFNDIYQNGMDAISQLEEGGEGEGSEAEEIRSLLNRLAVKKAKAENVEIDGVQSLRMPREMASDLIITDINKLANAIHRIGQSRLRTEGSYAGCVIDADIEDISGVNTGALRYCEGCLHLDHMRGTIIEPGNTVEHRPGSASNHANVVSFEEGDNGYDVRIEYSESGDRNWKDRQEGVRSFLEKKGMKCETAGLSMLCMGALGDDDISETALMFSQLKDIDLLEAECIPIAFDFTAGQTRDLMDYYRGNMGDMWGATWTRAGRSDDVVDCEAQIEQEAIERQEQREAWEERRARREARKEEERTHLSDIANRRHNADIAPCDLWAYRELSNAISDQQFHDVYCESYRDSYDTKSCERLFERERGANSESAASLISRCPAVPIIESHEADLNADMQRYDLSIEESIRTFMRACDDVATVCAEAGDEDCVKTIESIGDRVKRDGQFSAQKMPLGATVAHAGDTLRWKGLVDQGLTRSEMHIRNLPPKADAYSYPKIYDGLARAFDEIRQIDPICDKIELPADREECLFNVQQAKKVNRQTAVERLERQPPEAWRKAYIGTYTDWAGFENTDQLNMSHERLNILEQMCRDIEHAGCLSEIQAARTDLDRAAGDRLEKKIRDRMVAYRNTASEFPCFWKYGDVHAIQEMEGLLDAESKMADACAIYPTDAERTECMGRRDADVRMNAETARDFIQRCPPDETLEAVIKAYMHSGMHYVDTRALMRSMSSFESICKKADDKVCATVVDNIKQRIYKELSLAD